MKIVDFHNHVIPNVDDGAESLDVSLASLQNMKAQGIECVIATPHLRASTLNNLKEFGARIDVIDEHWSQLVERARKDIPNLRLERGVELALDEPLVRPPDLRTRLAETRFMLIEFPYFSVPPNSAQALSQIVRLGVTPIVAHPERYHEINGRLPLLGDWKASGAFLQLNAGSLVGAYGRDIQRVAWRLLRRGLADYISSDFHCRGECLTDPARQQMSTKGGAAIFKLLAVDNGSRLLEGLNPTPVPPLQQRETGWRRISLKFWRRR